jgi:surface protein
MGAMFQFAEQFQGGNLTGWNTSRVENMSATFASNTFASANAFTGDISTWDVSRVVSFGQAFYRNSGFNGNLSAWNTSSAIAMDEMFSEATAFSGDLSTWDTRQLTTASRMVSASLDGGVKSCSKPHHSAMMLSLLLLGVVLQSQEFQ